MAASGRAPLTVIVLAAGQGTRMKSERIKLLHEVAGRPMVARVLDATRALRPERTTVVVGFQADAVRSALPEPELRFALQREQLGTGHAVLAALREIGGLGPDASKLGTLLILNGDLPTLRPATLRALLRRHRTQRAALTFVTAEIDDPKGYGRVVRDDSGAPVSIVEHADADAATRAIREINAGVYCGDAALLVPVLKRLKRSNAQKEIYLTDAVAALIAKGRAVEVYRHGDAPEVLGVNTRRELAQATATWFRRKADALLDAGVTLLAPEQTFVSPEARIGRDTVIHPGVTIEGPSRIGTGCEIRSGCRLRNARVGADTTLLDHCLVTDATIGSGASVGPCAHLRPGSELGDRTKVGNFVETKKTRLGAGAKASHLAYLGDADIGSESNIGAGTITCNYDGAVKNRTVLGRGVFIGSDSQLVAPVRIGDGAYVGAGTTVTDDVPPGALALSRAKQLNLEGWVERRKQRRRKSGQKPKK